MKTVLISFYNVYPPTFGSASVTFNISKYLAGEKYLFHLGNLEDRVIDGNVNLINMMRIFHNRFLKMAEVFVGLFFVVRKILRLNPDFIILENASWAIYYLALFRLLKIRKSKIKIIYHAHCVEYLLRKQKNNILIAFFTRWGESILLKNSDLVFCVSEADAINFRAIYGVEAKILPNCVDIEDFNQVEEGQIISICKRYNLSGRLILFMGLPDFKPNTEAISLLINKIFPTIIREIPECRLVIIGGKVDYRRPWLINPGNIPFEEVPSLIKACEVCTAPIFSGSGVRLKILEYMAAAKPVVSTIEGAEGIKVSDGEDIIFAKRPGEFSEKILYLLRNPAMAEIIGRAAEKNISENYSWQKTMQALNETLLEYYYGHS
jgi:glycosyltransferase involved in cell wall biosynthesis